MPTTLKPSDSVQSLIDSYPDRAALRLRELRKIVLDAAAESRWVDELEETLKWGEPSYMAKYGSTVRMDWKPKKPDEFAIYFKCTSKLVPTFRELFPNHFRFDGNRAIIFGLEDEIPKTELKHCIKAALEYHKVKHLPLLGM